MGQALGERGGLMRSGPSKAAEAIVALLLPPACREEVLGDLHERYRSRLQYFTDALSTVPLVILSRIRRTADPQVLLIQAFALYASFLTAAWFKDAPSAGAVGTSAPRHPSGNCAARLDPGGRLRESRTPIAAETAPRPLARFRTRCRFAGRVPCRQLRSGCSILDHGLRIRHEFAPVIRDPAVVSAGHGPSAGV